VSLSNLCPFIRVPECVASRSTADRTRHGRDFLADGRLEWQPHSAERTQALLRSSGSYRDDRQSGRVEAVPKSRLLQFVEQAMHLARRTVARYSSRFFKPVHTPPARHLALSQSTERHDRQDASRRAHRNAPHSESHQSGRTAVPLNVVQSAQPSRYGGLACPAQPSRSRCSRSKSLYRPSVEHRA
jgi:hypothetical protein